MGAKFNLNDLMGKGKNLTDNKKYKRVKVDPREMIAAEENFYSMEQESIEELAKSILIVGLQQPIVLGKVEDEYRIISGHRRRAALVYLIANGYDNFREVDSLCTEMTDNMFNLNLIIGNAFNRRLTDTDILIQEQKLKEYLIKAKDNGEIEIKGKLRDCIADLMKLSRTKVAQIEAINNNLVEEAKEEVMKGQINFSNAYEMSKLPEEKQKELVEQMKEREVTGKEIKKHVEEHKENRKEDFDKEAEPTLRGTVAEEQLGERVEISKVSETDTKEEEKQEGYTVQEYSIVDILQGILEMYQLVNDEEFETLVEIFQACNERGNGSEQCTSSAGM